MEDYSMYMDVLDKYNLEDIKLKAIAEWANYDAVFAYLDKLTGLAKTSINDRYHMKGVRHYHFGSEIFVQVIFSATYGYDVILDTYEKSYSLHLEHFTNDIYGQAATLMNAIDQLFEMAEGSR